MTIYLFRIVFGVGQSLVLACLIWIYFEIPKSPDADRKLRLTQEQLEPPSPTDGLFGGDAVAKDKHKRVSVSYAEYDLVVWKRKLKQTVIAVTMICVLHALFGVAV